MRNTLQDFILINVQLYFNKVKQNCIFVSRCILWAEYKSLKLKTMFGLFKKKSEKEKLQEQYDKLLKEAYILSSTNRKMSDQKTFQANEILEQLEKLV